MAFGTINAFYTNGSGGFQSANVGGNRIAKLLASPDATTSTSTQTTHPANSSTRRVVSPYQASANAGPDSTRGLAIDPADMGSVAGALRFFPAGNHVAHFYATGGNTLGNNTYLLRAYRIGPSPAFAKTQIGGEASAAASGLGAAVAVSLALPEIVFLPGETILWTWDVQTNPGIVAGTVTISLGTSSALNGSVVARMQTPELGILAKARGAAAGVAAVQGQASIVLPARGASAGVASVQSQASSTAGGQGRAAGVASAQAQGSAVAGVQGRAAGVASVTGQASVVLGAVGTAVVGSGQSVIRRKRVVIFDRA